MNVTVNNLKELDKKDVFSTYRNEFYINEGTIYLDGNSLGLMSKRAENSLLKLIESWKTLGIEGWTTGENPWFYFAENLGELSSNLVGAKKEEVIITGSTTSNLHQLLATFYKPNGKKTKILADELNFPSDIYAIQSILNLKGYDPAEHLVQVKSKDGRFIREEDIIAGMTDDIALIILPTVLYRSGQLFNMEKITAEAHKRGIVIGWDGCHSVGAIPHKFHEWKVDFAYWCNYKYLNGGPGSIGALFVHENHFGKTPGLTGWFGSDKNKQFDMEHTFTQANHAGAYQIGTPPILSMAPLLGSLQMYEEVGIDKVREKSLHQTKILMDLIEKELQDYEFTIGNPTDTLERGGHVSLEHEDAARICKALKEFGIVPDFRKPNIIRLAPVAWYTSYEDLGNAISKLKIIMEDKVYEKYSNERGVVA
ncbi:MULTISPECIES: kynureninase [Bacillus]|uniref:kynureninase n=1 Tax=Bacillus TaxID=1386 RepID=UPI000BB75BD4|nr:MULTISPECIES: kynureninase [Bacillus]